MSKTTSTTWDVLKKPKAEQVAKPTAQTPVHRPTKPAPKAKAAAMQPKAPQKKARPGKTDQKADKTTEEAPKIEGKGVLAALNSNNAETPRPFFVLSPSEQFTHYPNKPQILCPEFPTRHFCDPASITASTKGDNDTHFETVRVSVFRLPEQDRAAISLRGPAYSVNAYYTAEQLRHLSRALIDAAHDLDQYPADVLIINPGVQP